MRTLFLDYFAQGLVLGLAALALLAAAPWLQKRYSARWFCRAWLVLALLLALPLRLLLPEAAPAPVTLTPPPALLAAVSRDQAAPAIGEGAAPEGEPAAPADPGAAKEESGSRPALSSGQSAGQPLLPSASGTGEGDLAPESSGATSGEIPVSVSPAPPAAFTPLDGLALLWLAGALGVAGWQWCGYFVWRHRALRRALPAGGEWQAALGDALARQPLARRPRLLASPDVTGAMAAGIFRPVLLVPEGAGPDGDAACLLAHELAHLKRRDLARKALFSLVLALHWYDPAVWLLAKRAGRDMETACDEVALAALGAEHRAAYCDALLRAVSHGRAPALTTCFSLTKRDVKARFARLWDTSPKRRGAAALAVFCLAAALAGTLVACNASPAASNGEPPASVSASEPAASPTPDYSTGEEVWPAVYHRGVGPVPLPDEVKGNAVVKAGYASPDGVYAGMIPMPYERDDPASLTLWNTSDGGESWTTATLDFSPWLEAMEEENGWAALKADGVGDGNARVEPSHYQFVSPTTGFLVYYGAWDYGPAHNRHTVYTPGFVVLRTTDGGESWQEMYSGDGSDFAGGTGKGISLFASTPFAFLNENVGFLCAHGGDYGTNGQFNLLRTTDGGVTWQLLDLDEVAATLPGAPWEQCHICGALGLGAQEPQEPDLFASAQPGFAAFVGWGDAGDGIADRVVFYTRDWGESWLWMYRFSDEIRDRVSSSSGEVNDQ